METLSVETCVRQFVTKYFPESTGIMIFGSNAGKTTLSGDGDLDIILLTPTGYFKSLQRIWLENIYWDILLIPVSNFEAILLKDVSRPVNNSIVHALSNGSIIQDDAGRLQYYKETATYLLENKKSFVYTEPGLLTELFNSIDKLLGDYMVREASVESHIILSQLVNCIIDVELLFNIGMSSNGKIKSYLLKSANTTLHLKLSEALEKVYKHDDKAGIAAIAAGIISRYKHATRDNQWKYAPDHRWHNKLVLDVTDKGFLPVLTDMIRDVPYIEWYYLHAPFKGTGDLADKLIIRTTASFLPDLIHQLLEKTQRQPASLINPIPFILLEQFWGGKRYLEACEPFFAFLTKAVMNGGPDPAILQIVLLFTIGNSQGMSCNEFSIFVNYLFDQWFPLSFDRYAAPYKQTLEARKKLYTAYQNSLLSQQPMLQFLQASILNHWPSVNLEGYSGAQIAGQFGHTLRLLEGIPSAVPDFEIRIVLNYHASLKQPSQWYLYRKIMEIIFSILNVRMEDWGYISFIAKNLMETPAMLPSFKNKHM